MGDIVPFSFLIYNWSMARKNKETIADGKERQYQNSIASVKKALTWDVVETITLKEMTDAVKNINVERIIMPTAKSTGKSRFVAIYCIYMFYHDKEFNACGGRKKKLDNPKMVTIFKRAIIDIEQAIGLELSHHFEYNENMILTRIIFHRSTKKTNRDQRFDFFSFDQPDSIAGLAPQFGYYGVVWLEEPVQQTDTSGISHDEYLLSYLTLIDTVNRFALALKKRFLEFATMNGWDEGHFFIKLAEDIMPWEDFLEWASRNWEKNNALLKIRDSDAIIRATKYCNPIIKGNAKEMAKIEELMTYDTGRAIALGQIVESEIGDDLPYAAPLGQYGNHKTIFKLNKNHTILDVDYGYDHGTWAAEVIAEVVTYIDHKDFRMKKHFNAVFIIWNEMLVNKMKMNRVPEPEVEDLAAKWLKDRRHMWTKESSLGYDYSDKTSIRNIENILRKKYSIIGLDFVEYTDKNKKGVFDVETRERQNLSLLNNKWLTFSPEVYEWITNIETGQPWKNLKKNGKITIDKSDKSNKDDILEAYERAARHQIEEVGDKYEQY